MLVLIKLTVAWKSNVTVEIQREKNNWNCERATKDIYFLKYRLTLSILLTSVDNKFHMKVMMFQNGNGRNWIHLVKTSILHESKCYLKKLKMPQCDYREGRGYFHLNINLFHRNKRTSAHCKERDYQNKRDEKCTQAPKSEAKMKSVEILTSQHSN